MTSSPAAGFEVPLEMLAACHGRVQAQCETLLRLLDHLPRHGADQDAREVAGKIVRYFDTAARDHHADEETDLFPALRAAATAAERDAVDALTQQLVVEHRQLELQWTGLRQQLQALAAGDATALKRGTAEAFIARYAAHIADEDAQLLPLAAQLLPVASLDHVGRAMRQRRGIRAPG